jgi:Mg2+-importing ATPase
MDCCGSGPLFGVGDFCDRAANCHNLDEQIKIAYNSGVSTDKPLGYFGGCSIDQVYDVLKTSKGGLTHQESAARIKKYGANALARATKRNAVLLFLSSFSNPLVLILLFASVISFFLGQVVDGAIIAAIIISSATLNFIQEHKANVAAEKLKDQVSFRTTVFREGKSHEVKVEDIAPGDVILLSAGDLIPADVRIISSDDFFVAQSSLTGESFPVEKSAEKIDGEKMSLDMMTNIGFFGSSVVSGFATVVVVKTGTGTEFGKISHTLATTPADSDFIKGVKSFSGLILKTTVFFVLFIFLFNLVFNKADVFETFMFAVAVAVGLTPELLPMIMSVSMGRGSVNMAKKGVIVKKLSAIPNFGSMDVLCTDKTGTLTKDKIELVKYVDLQNKHSENVLLHAFINSSFHTGIKNPMDEAVVNFRKIDDHGYKKIDEIPFDFIRKRMSVVAEKNKKRTMVTKGAPEEIYKICTYLLKNGKKIAFDEKNITETAKLYKTLSNEGYRVLAVAVKNISDKKNVYAKEEERDLMLIGYIGFLDPPKDGLSEVLADLEKMGVEVKVITGDNELVTRKICGDIGLPIKGIIMGNEIETLSDDGLKVVAENNTIFARFSPEQKNRVITALKNNGHVVGYMGDGINDAPALVTADVGISVENAVDVARESADLILTHKSLEDLLAGALQGRKTFGNTMKYIMMGISSNFGNMFSVLGAVIFLPYLPMLPIQILLNNFLYDASQLTIPGDNVDPEFTQSPKRWDMNFIKYFMVIFGSISSVFDFLTFYVLYGIFKATAPQFQTGWFLESLATQTLVIYVIRTNKIPFLQSVPSKYLVLSSASMVILGWLIPTTRLGHFFGFVQLQTQLLIVLGAIVISYLFMAELGKRLFYKKFSI